MLKKFNLKSMCYNILMRYRKDGKLDKRYKMPKQTESPKKESLEPKLPEGTRVINIQFNKQTNPQNLFYEMLEKTGIKLDFDVLEGTITTQHGVIKLDKPTLVIKATYEQIK